MNPDLAEVARQMLSKQEANEYYKDEVERYRAVADEQQHRRLDMYMRQLQQPAHQRPVPQPPPTPTFRNAERASLAADGIVIEAGNGMERIVVRGDLLKTLATLVVMAQMAGLLAKDDNDPAFPAGV